MADDDMNNDEAEGEEESVGGKKTPIIIIGVVLLLAAVGAGLFFSGMLGGGEEGDETHAEEGHGDDHAKKGDGHGDEIYTPVYMELPPFLVNINSGTNRTSFLKMKVTLELTSEEALQEANLKQPKILDAFNTYLRELRTSDLSGSAGIFRLRQELLARTNKTLHPLEVKDILFSEIVVQ